MKHAVLEAVVGNFVVIQTVILLPRLLKIA
jgi:hypothetical protein